MPPSVTAWGLSYFGCFLQYESRFLSSLPSLVEPARAGRSRLQLVTLEEGKAVNCQDLQVTF
jgi:hypothetical protein